MATTTQRAIYAGILADLHAAASDGTDDIGVDSGFIYITPIPVFTQSDERIIQVIPGTPSVETPISGLGLVDEDFHIAVWARVFLDQAGHSTARITNSTLGALVTTGQVRQTLIQSDANSLATVPVRWVGGSVPIESEEAPGWVYYEDTYNVGYEIVWG